MFRSKMMKAAGNSKKYTTLVNSFSIPGTIGGGTTFYNGNMISSDGITDLIYIHSGVTPTITSSFTQTSYITGLVVIGSDLWSCDYLGYRINQHSGISSTIVQSFYNQYSFYVGISYDGTNLLSSQGDALRIHNGLTSTVSTTVPFNSYQSTTETTIKGIVYDGTNLITIDNSGIMRTHNGLTQDVLYEFDTGIPYDPINGNITGMGFVDGKICISSYQDAMFYFYE